MKGLGKRWNNKTKKKIKRSVFYDDQRIRVDGVLKGGVLISDEEWNKSSLKKLLIPGQRYSVESVQIKTLPVY